MEEAQPIPPAALAARCVADTPGTHRAQRVEPIATIRIAPSASLPPVANATLAAIRPACSRCAVQPTLSEPRFAESDHQDAENIVGEAA